ncbi:MAG: hypothetical protein Q8O76_00475, partial [Chloroflexota bacterium]|nr:hypothetical protein [Chloroflexota bacterium]
RYFMNDAPVLWVFGQVEAQTGRTAYGHPTEDSAMGYFGFEGGVRAFLETGAFTPLGNHRVVVFGTEGWLEVNPKDLHDMAGPHLRFQRRGSGCVEEVMIDNTDHNVRSFVGVLDALVTWLNGGPESPTSARNARFSQEAVFAIVESARLGSIVSLPLKTTDQFPNETLFRVRRVSTP